MFVPSLTIGLICVLAPPAEALKADRQTVVIEALGITCMGRFTDSLKEHIVLQHSWVHSVRINYAADRPTRPQRPQGIQKFVSGTDILFSARTSVIRFEIDKQVPPRRLARLLKSCGYYDTKRWTLVSRVPFSTIGSAPTSDANR